MSHWQEKPILAVFILLLIFGPLYFFALGQSSLWEEDEAIYAEIAREMSESGDFVGTFFNYAPRFDKPPLTFWLIALSYRLFGINEFAVRFFSALLGLAGLLLLYTMIRHTHGAPMAFSSALILGSSLEYPALAIMGLTDMPLTFFTILTFYGIWRAYIREETRFYLLASLAAAMATLTKGPIGLLLPGGAFAVLWAAGTAWSLARWAQKLGRQPRPADVEPLTWALAERGRGISAVDYLTAVHDGQR
ncbi:MAG: glycosyltransferase family 39 protein, partial [Firmicutes bacterium]|nr:glycosyltransferase family 39 protein [Bacillota bacterium]